MESRFNEDENIDYKKIAFEETKTKMKIWTIIPLFIVSGIWIYIFIDAGMSINNVLKQTEYWYFYFMMFGTSLLFILSKVIQIISKKISVMKIIPIIYAILFILWGLLFLIIFEISGPFLTTHEVLMRISSGILNFFCLISALFSALTVKNGLKESN